MEVWYAIVQFFSNGGAFMYPIVLLLALGLGVSVERYITLTLARTRNRQTWEKLEDADPQGRVRAGSRAREQGQFGDRATVRVRSRAPRRRPAPRGPRSCDGRDADGDHSAPREAHALPRDVREHVDARRPARHDHRLDPCVHGRIECGPRRQGRAAVGQHLDRHELHGVRPDGRDPARARALAAADEDDRAHRQPRDGVGEDREHDRRALALRETGFRRRGSDGRSPCRFRFRAARDLTAVSSQSSPRTRATP